VNDKIFSLKSISSLNNKYSSAYITLNDLIFRNCINYLISNSRLYPKDNQNTGLNEKHWRHMGFRALALPTIFTKFLQNYAQI
jgi:hypothetical protein